MDYRDTDYHGKVLKYRNVPNSFADYIIDYILITSRFRLKMSLGVLDVDFKISPGTKAI